jgi:hypothetical protein
VARRRQVPHREDGDDPAQQAADQVLRENPLYDETRAALAAILDKAAIEIELFEEDWEKVADELTATQAAAIRK